MIIQVPDIDREKYPDLLHITSRTIREGPLSRKEVGYKVIADRHAGEYHHDEVTLKTFKKRQGEWKEDVEHSVTLSSKESDEIQAVVDFIAEERWQVTASEDMPLAGNPEDKSPSILLSELVKTASAEGKADILTDVLLRAIEDKDIFNAILARAARDPLLFVEAAAALNIAAYRGALDELIRLVNSPDSSESQFQSLLSQNPWMFGSEYSELLSRRNWTRDQTQDFVMRRTADGYIEVIEIKTPLDRNGLFRHDTSHDSYFPRAELSKVLGQVQCYIEELETNRATILYKDGEDTAKIRAKIIIGRDGDKNQCHALRRFNGHLHRLEVLTFDQLIRIAERVLEYLEGTLSKTEERGGEAQQGSELTGFNTMIKT